MPVPLRFGYAPVPWWTWLGPAAARALEPLAGRRYPVRGLADPQDPTAMAGWLRRWRTSDTPESALAERLSRLSTQVLLHEGRTPGPGTGASPASGLRLPAQWEATETVLVVWPVLFPGLWAFHAELVRALAAAVEVTVLVPDAGWGPAVLHAAEPTDPRRVKILVVPTDDIWIRDFGPLTTVTADGSRTVVSAIYDPPPRARYERDQDAAPRWARHRNEQVRRVDLHLEGGNLWSDGQGTLFTTDGLYKRNPRHSPQRCLDLLSEATGAKKIIVLPRLRVEATGHVDLLVKLAGPASVLLTEPAGLNRRALAQAWRTLRSAVDACGRAFELHAVPSLPPYLAWGVIPVWRTYTNSITVNGRVIVPMFGVPQDEEALRAYRRAMPDHDVVAVDASIAANGGGTVHCLTMQVPA